MQKFIDITGSIPMQDGEAVINLGRQTAYSIARELLRQDFGIVTLIGASPNPSTAAFSDLVMKAAADHAKVTDAPATCIKAVANSATWQTNLTEEVIKYLETLGQRLHIEDIPNTEYTGGTIRQLQANLSDGAIIIGGTRGSTHTTRLLTERQEPAPVVEVTIAGCSSGLPEDLRERLAVQWPNASTRSIIKDESIPRVAHAVAAFIQQELTKLGASNPEAESDPTEQKDGKTTAEKLGWLNFGTNTFFNLFRAVQKLITGGGDG